MLGYIPCYLSKSWNSTFETWYHKTSPSSYRNSLDRLSGRLAVTLAHRRTGLSSLRSAPLFYPMRIAFAGATHHGSQLGCRVDQYQRAAHCCLRQSNVVRVDGAKSVDSFWCRTKPAAPLSPSRKETADWLALAVWDADPRYQPSWQECHPGPEEAPPSPKNTLLVHLKEEMDRAEELHKVASDGLRLVSQAIAN